MKLRSDISCSVHKEAFGAKIEPGPHGDVLCLPMRLVDLLERKHVAGDALYALDYLLCFPTEIAGVFGGWPAEAQTRAEQLRTLVSQYGLDTSRLTIPPKHPTGGLAPEEPIRRGYGALPPPTEKS